MIMIMISSKILIFVCSISALMAKNKEKWTCKRCGKVNYYERTYGYFPENPYKELGNIDEEHNKKIIKSLKDSEKRDREKGGDIKIKDIRAHRLYFDDNSYICDDRIVGE